MLSQESNGLRAIGAPGDDIRLRFVRYAADFFGSVAKGESPPKPEPFVAELVADTCAKLVGAEVPMPLDAAPTGATRPVPGATIQESPEAMTWLMSHGYGGGKRPYQGTRLLMSAFLQNPKSWWKANDIAKRLGKRHSAVTHLLSSLYKGGLLTREGSKTKCRWKLADMPPHV